ncbi:hypothetical protein BGZ83_000729 [Gryganskiella cystojenkinii]|nr:hypothetical protein BGZ83_000729 [Gryganskiella cystojenkinii]
MYTAVVENAFRKPIFCSVPVVPSIARVVSRSNSRSHWIIAGTATTVFVGPVILARTSFGGLWFKNPVAYCAAATGATPTTTRLPHDKDPFINTKELSFGAAMGLCSGYLFKKLGKMFLLVAGLGFVCLQMLSNSGYIRVDWSKLENTFKSQLDLDKDGKVTTRDAKHGIQWVMDLLTRNFQFKSTFAGGFFLGFRYG